MWRQTWVDNNGTYLDFTGSLQEGRMILIRDAVVRGKACKQRVIGYDIQDDQFRWIRERSDDGGQTWRVLWKTHYTRKKSELS